MYVIAEAGVNHNGSPTLAHELIEAAYHAGADAVKFQTFCTQHLVTTKATRAAYQRQTIGEGSQAAMLAALELPFEVFRDLKSHAEGLKLDFLSTPFDGLSAQFLIDLGLETFKIGSGDLDNLPLLMQLGATKRQLILSCGMSTLGEIETALGAIAFGQHASGEKPSLKAFHAHYAASELSQSVSLLHCTSDYPAPPQSLNLRAIPTLKAAFALKTGFSDHSSGDAAAMMALAFGAEILEKHLTLDTAMQGPDHAASLNPSQFTTLVNKIKTAKQMLGTGLKKPMPNEMATREVARKRVVAAFEIKKGAVFTPQNLTLKRAENGLDAPQLFALYGQKATRAFMPDEGITP